MDKSEEELKYLQLNKNSTCRAISIGTFNALKGKEISREDILKAIEEGAYRAIREKKMNNILEIK